MPSPVVLAIHLYAQHYNFASCIIDVQKFDASSLAQSFPSAAGEEGLTSESENSR